VSSRRGGSPRQGGKLAAKSRMRNKKMRSAGSA